MTKAHLVLIASLAFVGLQFVAPPVIRAADCLSAVNAPGCTHGLPTEQYEALLPAMLANPEPGVRPLAVDVDTVNQYSSGAARRASSFAGVLVDGPLPYPMAWMVRPTKPSAVPGRTPDKAAPTLPRYSRVYVFAMVKAQGWKWYLVGPGRWIKQTSLALVAPARKPDGVQGRWVAVDLWQQVFTAYEDDRLVFTTLISSGMRRYPTRQGLFNIWIRLRTDDMSGSMGAPDEYNLPYVPFVMYFDKGISLHGAYWHDGFGFPRSHGCVNMSLTDAHWLFDWTEAAPTASVYVWSSR
jgi:lipoprotein-anchoring transpeptidase ErfK/SrfK